MIYTEDELNNLQGYTEEELDRMWEESETERWERLMEAEKEEERQKDYDPFDPWNNGYDTYAEWLLDMR